MYLACIDPPWDTDAWRDVARAAFVAGVAPHDISWNGDAQSGLLAGVDVNTLQPVRAAPRVSAEFLSLAGAVLCHRDTTRHALLYRLLWRIGSGEPQLLSWATDTDVHRANELAKAVRRDSHKMKAFVRFREVAGRENTFVAWFEPDHHIIDRVAPFFSRRFTGMHWAILTPDRSAWWNEKQLDFGAGASRSEASADDAQEALWRTYYANIFNPARLNPTMMRQEMPQKYWKNLPEAELLPGLIRDAGQRTREMTDRTPQSARRKIPTSVTEAPLTVADHSVEGLAREAQVCRRCELWRPATQVVFGRGPTNARLMIVGEQPGDEEDLSGRPFVGPAGKLLDRALRAVGLDPNSLYLTNAVKHFRFEQRGKRRLHKTPAASQVRACAQWLGGELATVQPKFVVCLGATAANALLGDEFRLTHERGQWKTRSDGLRVLATVHPDWMLRQPAESRDAAFDGFVEDLRLIKVAIDDEGSRGNRE